MGGLASIIHKLADCTEVKIDGTGAIRPIFREELPSRGKTRNENRVGNFRIAKK